MSPSTVAVRDIQISYTDLGSGRPLLLLHGGLGTSEMFWPKRYPLLAEHFRVLAPDSRGHGLTTNPSGHLGYDQMADDMVAFCAALNVTKPLVLGFSDGGQIAIELGLRHPDFASALVMGGTVGERTDDYLASLHQWGFIDNEHVDVEQLERSWGPFFQTLTSTHKGNGEPDYGRRMLVHISRLWLTVPTYSAEQLASITTPTLVITGDRDDLAGPDQAIRLYKLLGKAELAILPGVGHSTEGDLFWSAAMDFLLRQT